MNFREIRQKFLEFFKNRGHEIVSSSSLIPRDDPTLLFTNAGMVQFKRLFLGEEKRHYTRAATSQKCVRAGGKHNDLDNVGYTARHHTFFEMLGNFSFGDYFKKEAIAWAWELLIEGYRLPAEHLYVSVFEEDEEAYRIWNEDIGIPPGKIIRLGAKDNFWAMGETGPCGPCSEILIDQGPSVGCGRPDCGPGCDCDRYLEIWNLVFTQFDRDIHGNLTPLPKPNIDTGMGLERLAAVIQGVKTNYETDLFKHIIAAIEDISEKKFGEDQKETIAFRVIADHARAAAFLIGDGIMPSNEGRGYVLRRIIRRAIRFGQVLGINGPFLHVAADKVIDVMGPDYSELIASRSFIDGMIMSEEKRFADTLFYGMRVLRDEVDALKGRGEDIIPGNLVFKLYDTYGLSPDILEDVAHEEGLKVDLAGYNEAMARQRSQSQESWRGSGEEEVPDVYRKMEADGVAVRFLGYGCLETRSKILAIVKDGNSSPSAGPDDEIEVILDQTPFYGEAGGQVGDRGWLIGDGSIFQVTDTIRFGHDFIVHQGKVMKGSLKVGDEVEAGVDFETRRSTALNHTATHLLHAALRDILGDHVKQAGSLVAPDRLRFDFSHFAQVDRERLREVENKVNELIRENLPVTTDVMAREEAMQTGAMAIFEERYAERVRLVRVGGDRSMELCGGTHTERTGDIGLFKIISESAVGANLRRIEAVTGKAALDFIQRQDEDLKNIALILKTNQDQVVSRVERLVKEQREKEKEIASFRAKLVTKQSGDLLDGIMDIGGIKILSREVDAPSPKDLREFADRIRDRIQSGVIVLGAKSNGKVMLICLVTRDLVDRFKAGHIISRLSAMVGGKGGGRPDMAQGGGTQPEKLADALRAVSDIIGGG